jgi:hypothetical protein
MQMEKEQLVRLAVSQEPGAPLLQGIVQRVDPGAFLVVLNEDTPLPPQVQAGAAVVLEVLTLQGVSTAKTTLVELDKKVPRGLWLSSPRVFEGAEQRAFLRINIAKTFAFTVQTSDVPAHLKWKNVSAVSKDLSAGGMCFETAHELAVGDIVALQWDTAVPPAKAPALVDLKAKILRAVPAAQQTPPKFAYAVIFVEIPERHRSQLMRYVFQLQRQGA